MPALNINANIKKKLLNFLQQQKKTELITAYLYFIEESLNVHPVIYAKEKCIYQSMDSLISSLEDEGKLWRETEIKIQLGKKDVNSETQRVYICPFSGKVFGDNTHPNPQDAIYDWVAKCPENTEIVGGLKAKRFYVSDDPEIIKNYIQDRKKTLTKIVFSSVISGKLFGSKQAIIDDFKKNYTKPIGLVESQAQNRFQFSESFINLLQNHVTEEKIQTFVEALAEDSTFNEYVSYWTEAEQEEEVSENA